MKKSYSLSIILLIAMVVLVVLIWWWPKQPVSTTTIQTGSPSNVVSAGTSTRDAKGTVTADSTNQLVQSKTHTTNSMQEFFDSRLEAKNAAIKFYGRVIDQYGNGLAGVQVSMHVRQWHIDAKWGNTFPKFERITDSTGNFSIENASGDYLTIDSVVKNGYRLSPKAPNSFGYGSVPVPFRADSGNPVIIKMWKSTESANLISHRTLFGFEPDGRIYTLNLQDDRKNSDGSSSGDLRIQFHRQAVLKPKEIYPWSVEISAIGGGLIEATDEFEYLAPDSGYQPQILIQTNSISPKAMPDITKDYYFRSRNGQVYGVVTFQIYSDYNGKSAILVDSRLNPNGSRNLQP